MLTKAQAKYIQNLGHKKLRENESLFVAEGPKLVLELLDEPTLTLQSAYATEAFVGANPALKNISEVSETDLQRISFLSTPNQVVALFHKPVFAKPTSFLGQVSLMLETIQDPGNMGSILRIADWFGIKTIICSKDSADIFNPKVVQSTMGSIARVHVIYEDLENIIQRNRLPPIYASTLNGKSVFEIDPLKEAIILIGNESKGISEQLLSHSKETITIPRKGKAESLNAAVATGIILSQLVK
jgi:RNA methyltransferase, TrmH family